MPLSLNGCLWFGARKGGTGGQGLPSQKSQGLV